MFVEFIFSTPGKSFLSNGVKTYYEGWNGTLCFFVVAILSLSLFFSPSKKKRHRIKSERSVMATKKLKEYSFIIMKDLTRDILVCLLWEGYMPPPPLRFNEKGSSLRLYKNVDIQLSVIYFLWKEFNLY